MAVGFDVSHDAKSKAQSFGAFVASMDLRESVKYYSAVSKHQNGEELAGNIAVHMQQALIVYKQQHGMLPERIIFYRDGVGEGQIEYVHTYELQKILQVIKANYQLETPKFAFVIVSKRINTRFFEEKSGNRYENPVSGTVVDNTVTLPHR
jgi:aubergine-like protein